MSPIPENEVNVSDRSIYYIPHHAVFKPDSTSTKVRIVFDASAKSTTGVSLNSLLPPGPVIQEELFGQLQHFRQDPVGLKGDIEKMYLQIMVRPEDRDFLRIVWRESPDGPIRHYRLNVVTFGVTTSPFLACWTLDQLSKDEASNFPEAAAALSSRFYVDDYSSSVISTEKAKELQTQLTQLLKSAGFRIRKWATNDPKVLAQIPVEDREMSDALSMDDTSNIKTLGLIWSPSMDILSEISKIFDPLGFLGPVVVKAKSMMQAIWKEDVGWDDLLPPTLSQQWEEIAKELPLVADITIPRALRHEVEGTFEFHGFCDASEMAYAASIYLRCVTYAGISSTLIASKARIAPLKLLTIPRLELQGAVLLVELWQMVKAALKIPIENTFLWTDSSIVLHWLNDRPSRWKLFVRNRVARIQELSSAKSWAHVISEENTADCASRGMLPAELVNFSLWWNGPEWLREPSISQPPLPGRPTGDLEHAAEPLPICTMQVPFTFDKVLSRTGSWTKALLVLARLHSIFRLKSLKNTTGIMAQDWCRAEGTLGRVLQQVLFPEAIAELTQDPMKQLNKPLRALRPFWIRMGHFELVDDLPSQHYHIQKDIP